MKCYNLYTKYDDLLKMTWENVKEYRAAHACTQCFGASAAWRAHPVPIDIEIIHSPRGPIAVVGDCFPIVMRADLAETLTPYLPSPLFGRVTVIKPKLTDRPGMWVTCAPGEGCGVETGRGKYCRHVFCVGGCGGGGNLVGWANGAVLRRDIGDRLAFFGSDLQTVFVTDALIGKLDLKKRFPDLRFYEYDVVDEPLDGEVLPGDPGWDGIFRSGPDVFVPEDVEPKRGRSTIP